MQGPWDYGSSECCDWGNKYIMYSDVGLLRSSRVSGEIWNGMEKYISQGTQIKYLRIMSKL